MFRTVENTNIQVREVKTPKQYYRINLNKKKTLYLNKN